MKHTIYILLLAIAVGFTQCCKEKTATNTDIPGLPPATQTGANTLGFLLNGVPWVPEGPNNLSMDYDPGFNDGILGIVAYRKILYVDNSVFSFGIQDSINFMTFPKTIPVSKSSLAQFSFTDKAFCERIHYDTTVFRSGELIITLLDNRNRVISGKFNTVLYNPICGDTIKITNGRFDMKF
jgi:hypothetical protein